MGEPEAEAQCSCSGISDLQVLWEKKCLLFSAAKFGVLCESSNGYLKTEEENVLARDFSRKQSQRGLQGKTVWSKLASVGPQVPKAAMCIPLTSISERRRRDTLSAIEAKPLETDANAYVLFGYVLLRHHDRYIKFTIPLT